MAHDVNVMLGITCRYVLSLNDMVYDGYDVISLLSVVHIVHVICYPRSKFIDGFVRLRRLRQLIDKYLLNTCPLVGFMYQLMSIYHLMIFLLSSSLPLFLLLSFCYYLYLIWAFFYQTCILLSDLNTVLVTVGVLFFILPNHNIILLVS